MKLEHLLAKYLYQHHKLMLRGIGYFTVDETDFNIVNNAPIPADAILFHQDTATPGDEGLINYVVADSAKMHSLAEADIETLIDNGKQLLNIAQLFTLEGIGSLQKNSRGEISFTPGHYLYFAEKNIPATSSSISSRARQWKYLVIIVIILAGGWWGYREWFNNTAASHATTPTPALPVQDSSTTQKNIAPEKTIAGRDAISYNIVFEIADSARAFARYDELKSWGDNVIMYTSDSLTYKLAAPFVTPARDTGAVKDSISKFFGREVFLEKR